MNLRTSNTERVLLKKDYLLSNSIIDLLTLEATLETRMMIKECVSIYAITL